MVPLFSMTTTSTNTRSPVRKNAVLFGNGLIRTLGSPSSIDPSALPAPTVKAANKTPIARSGTGGTICPFP